MDINDLILVLVQILVVLILLNLGTLLIKQGLPNRLLHKYMLASASFLFSAELLLNIIQGIPNLLNWNNIDITHDWVKLLALVTLLAGLGLLIRQSKPKVTRAPIILTFLPFLLILAYPLIMETFIIKQFMFNLLFIGAVIISTLMYSFLTFRERNYQIVLLAIVFFAIALLVEYVYPSGMAISYLCVMIALYLFRRGYKKYEFNL